MAFYRKRFAFKCASFAIPNVHSAPELRPSRPHSATALGSDEPVVVLLACHRLAQLTVTWDSSRCNGCLTVFPNFQALVSASVPCTGPFRTLHLHPPHQPPQSRDTVIPLPWPPGGAIPLTPLLSRNLRCRSSILPLPDIKFLCS